MSFQISCIVITIYDAVYLTSEPNKLHEEVKASKGHVEISKVEEKPKSKNTSTASDKKDKKKKKEKEESGNITKSEKQHSSEKQKSFIKENVAETEKIKDINEIKSMENEITRTNTEEVLDLKHVDKTENTNDDKNEKADTIDQHKNNETEKEDKTMKATSIQINEETTSERTELKDKFREDFDAEDLVEENLN